MTTGQISAAEFAVLSERVERVIENHSELRGLILSQNAQLSQVPVILERLSDQGAQIGRIFSTLKTNTDRITALEKVQDRHQFIVRLIGATLIASLSVIGWGWHQGMTLFNNDSALDRRILFIEYKLGVPIAEGAK
jgi:hypothetical protein